MATTSQLLTWIELECHGWQREGTRGTRALLNEAHKILLQQQCEQNIIYDSATGDLPLITTVAGTFRYNCPSDVWIVGGVLVSNEVMSSYDYGGMDNYSNLQLEDYTIGGMAYKRIRNIRTKPWDRRADAWIQFTGYDPGDSTDVYRRLAWKRAVEILSDSIQHEMPGTTDVEFLQPATIQLISAINDHGKYAEAVRYIREVLKPQLWQSLDGGEMGQSDFVTKRAY